MAMKVEVLGAKLLLQLNVAQYTASLAVAFLLLLALACNSAKNLNESTGKELLQEQLSADSVQEVAKGYLLVNLTTLQTRWIGQETTVDLSNSSQSTSDQSAEASMLLRSGFIAVEKNSRTYSIGRDWTGAIHSELLMWPSIQVHLNQVSPNGDITGTWSAGSDPQGWMPCIGATPGRIEINGRLSLSLSGCLRQPLRVSANLVSGGGALTHISSVDVEDEFGSPMTEPGRNRMPYTVTIESKNPQPVQMPLFRYSWSPKIQDFTAGPYAWRVGQVNVEQITDLTLAGTETQAKANFRWSLAPNDLGRALQGTPVLDGGRHAMKNGNVQFTKKPDGTWVVSQFSL